MKKENKIKLCWIHKIAMQEVKQEEPIPEYGVYKYKEFKCPMCMKPIREE
jgi:hypothetical protein